MNRIAQLLTSSNVIVELDATSKKRVFEQVGLLFENALQIKHNQVFDSLFARENWVPPDSVKVLQFRMAESRGYVMLQQHLSA